MWNLAIMNVQSFKGLGFIRKLKSVFSMPSAIIQSFIMLHKTKPDMVISVGGYVAGPITFVAAVFGIPTVAMEQNAIAGITTRILGKFVKKVFVTFPESLKYFSKNKVVVVGNPVRKKIREVVEHGQQKKHGFTILIFGGSQGAKTINEKMIEALPHLADISEDVKIIHQVGRLEDIERYSAAYRARGFKAEVYHFIEDMGKAYSQSDLVICRAGATSVAELTVAAKPAILIPYPFAADNHQEANALALVENGAAIMVRDKELTGEDLAAIIKSIFDDPLKLTSMSEEMRRLGKPDAAKTIVDECVKLVKPV
jgi:UDP-N-acetylglucosamine--N-acetylmuramyl-(pentapeptide) pyrophosphoryl-undecaprenol N-acetylglucosamine transferase